MPDIGSISSIGGVIQFIIWNLAVLGLSKAIFRSMIGERLSRRLAYRRNLDTQKSKTLSWELHFREEWSKEKEVRKSRGPAEPNAKARKFTDEEVEDRKAKLQTIYKASRLPNLVSYVLTCMFCQSFWSALGLMLLTNLESGAQAIIMSSFAYAMSAVVIHGVFLRMTFVQPTTDEAGRPRRGGGSCAGGDCGHAV